MGRKSSIEEAELIDRLAAVFRDVGYEGASVAMLAKATGLQKASLYHRFPAGKEQMAREVLAAAGAWLEQHVLSVLKASGTPIDRLREVAKRLEEFYSGGRQACLLNMLSSPRTAQGPFSDAIRQMFEALITALAKPVVDAGIDRKIARQRAEQAVVKLQGSLVVSRGVSSTHPFRDFLAAFPREMLAKS